MNHEQKVEVMVDKESSKFKKKYKSSKDGIREATRSITTLIGENDKLKLSNKKKITELNKFKADLIAKTCLGKGQEPTLEMLQDLWNESVPWRQHMVLMLDLIDSFNKGYEKRVKGLDAMVVKMDELDDKHNQFRDTILSRYTEMLNSSSNSGSSPAALMQMMEKIRHDNTLQPDDEIGRTEIVATRKRNIRILSGDNPFSLGLPAPFSVPSETKNKGFSVPASIRIPNKKTKI